MEKTDRIPQVDASDPPQGVSTISIVVATLNRPAQISDLMRSLVASSAPPFEIIIVDQSPCEETADVIAGYRDAKPTVVYIHDRAIRGASAARNVGIELANGEIVLFLDDDVILEPAFLEVMAAVLRKYPSCPAVSGVITNYTRPGFGSRLRNWLFFWGPFVDDRQFYYWRADALRGKGPFPVTRAGSGLLAVRRRLLESIRFRVLTGGYELGEDIDFSFQLAAHGALLLTPDARLVHVRAPGPRAARPRIVEEIESWTALYRRHLRGQASARLPYLVLIVCLGLQAALGIVVRRRWNWAAELGRALKQSVSIL